MARLFRLWEKKRGDRRTGSKLFGGVSEAVFSGLLFFFCSILLTALISWQVWKNTPLTLGFWLMAVTLGSLILIGGGGVIYTVLQVGTSAERRSALAKKANDLDLIRDAFHLEKDYPTVPGDANLTNSPGITLAYRLPTADWSGWRLTAAAVFCLAWNGIGASLLVITINKHLADKPEWLLTFFLIPYLVVGVAAIYYFLQLMLAITGIGPTSVEISNHPLVPGETYELYVNQSGGLSVNSLEVKLICVEEATYRQGTDVRTHHEAVYEQLLFREEDFTIEPGMPFEQECSLRIPEGAMHSFQSEHNSVAWKLVVNGDLESWPDYERSFPVIVYPVDRSKDAA